jgi:predicted dehydrogenase
MTERQSRPTRRRLLKAAIAAAAAPYVIPASALGRDGRPAPSDRIVMGCIGSGGRGQHNMRALQGDPAVEFVAVCDVDAKTAAAAQRLGGRGKGGCKAYRDFRELLDRGDLDAVDVSTPDHWHATPTIEACRRGLDVHVEKPLSLTIAEGRAMVSAARRHGRIVQTGSEARSSPSCRHACELIRNGRIGKVKEIYVGHVGSPPRSLVLPGEPVPEGLNWDLWLGPAPWRPYNKAYHPYTWRSYDDFSGGEVTDWGAHHFDLVQWALGMDDAGPVEIFPPDKDHGQVKFRYANGTMVYHGEKRGVKRGEPENLGDITAIGETGAIGFWYGGLQKTDPPELARSGIRPEEIQLYRAPPQGHEAGDFIRSVRTRQVPGADVEIGHRTVTVCHLVNICYTLKRPLRWDPVKEEFPGDEEANRLRSRAMRPPWTL